MLLAAALLFASLRLSHSFPCLVKLSCCSPDQLKPSVAAPASAVKREPVDPLNPSAAAPAPSVKVEAAEASKAPAGRQLEMSFYPKPEAQGWKLQVGVQGCRWIPSRVLDARPLHLHMAGC